MKTVAVLVLAFVLLPAVDAGAEDWSQRLEENSGSVVFVKFVLKIKMSRGGQTQDREIREEIQGVIINEKGLVLTANSAFDPGSSIPPRMRAQIEMSAEPTDLKVLFGSEDEEYEARLVARDSSLGLAFVQILDLKGRAVQSVKFSDEAGIAVGQEFFQVTRLERAFDCAPVLGKMFVNGKVEKPRELWSLAGQLSPAGLPVYNLDGVAVGVISVQEGTDERQTRRRRFLLPTSGFARSLKSASERAEQALEEAAEDEEDAEEDAEEGQDPKKDDGE